MHPAVWSALDMTVIYTALPCFFSSLFLLKTALLSFQVDVEIHVSSRSRQSQGKSQWMITCVMNSDCGVMWLREIFLGLGTA